MSIYSRDDLDDSAAVTAYILAHVIPGDGDACDQWTGWVGKTGYGKMHVYAHGKRWTLHVHRVIYLLAKGHLTPGLHVRHLCGNNGCGKLSHLEEGTSQENEADKERMGRVARGDRSGPRLHPERMVRGKDHYLAQQPERVRGERNPAARLTAPLVLEIRDLAAQGVDYAEIAARFGIAHTTVAAIATGRLWKHVGGPRTHRGQDWRWRRLRA